MKKPAVIPIDSEPAKPKKPRRKSPGRKRASTSVRRLAPGRGGQRLRSSINNLVGRESDRLARALIEKAAAGNMTGARLLVELSCADKAPPEKPKKRPGPNWDEILASEPEWTDEDERKLEEETAASRTVCGSHAE
ncbi:MAG: hypothetical protein ACRD3S_10505 [Terracidiphilus sp.]